MNLERIFTPEIVADIEYEAKEAIKTLDGVHIYNEYSGDYAPYVYPIEDLNFQCECMGWGVLEALDHTQGNLTFNNPDYFTIDDNNADLIFFHDNDEFNSFTTNYDDVVTEHIVEAFKAGNPPEGFGFDEIWETIQERMEELEDYDNARRELLKQPYTKEFKALEKQEADYDLPMFFAYSDKQFKEGLSRFYEKHPDQKDNKIIKFGIGGGFTTKPLAAEINAFFEKIQTRQEELLNAHPDLLSYQFEKELGNHEFIITYDPDPACQAVLGVDYEDLNEMQTKAFNKAVKRYKNEMEWLGY